MRGINLHKAGMEGLDAETIDKIIEENSRGQLFVHSLTGVSYFRNFS